MITHDIFSLEESPLTEWEQETLSGRPAEDPRAVELVELAELHDPADLFRSQYERRKPWLQDHGVAARRKGHLGLSFMRYYDSRPKVLPVHDINDGLHALFVDEDEQAAGDLPLYQTQPYVYEDDESKYFSNGFVKPEGSNPVDALELLDQLEAGEITKEEALRQFELTRYDYDPLYEPASELRMFMKNGRVAVRSTLDNGAYDDADYVDGFHVVQGFSGRLPK